MMSHLVQPRHTIEQVFFVGQNFCETTTHCLVGNFRGLTVCQKQIFEIHLLAISKHEVS